VPVPEIYGWRSDGNETFLYMEAIHGRTMEDAWPDLEEEDRLYICRELRAILRNLRLIRLPPTESYIGKVFYVFSRWIYH
jgi:aminoglycoside phosphotransferase